MAKRNMNADLARILAAILVIVLHVLGQGGVLRNASADTVTYWAAWFLEIGAFCAVDLFALISGYIMVNKTVKLKGIFSLWFQVLFYSVLISSLFFVFVPETLTAKNILVAVFPVLGKQWWYVSAYFGLVMFIPVLNAAANNLSRQSFQGVLLALLLVLGVANRVIPTDAFVLSEGNSAIWLIVMYLLGAYLQKYSAHEHITAGKSLLGFAAVTVLTFLSKLVIHFGTKRLLGEAKYDTLFISYTSVTVVLAAVFALLFCMKLKLGTVAQKLIGFFAPAALGIYLIHVHPLVFHYLFDQAFASFAYMSFAAMTVCVLLATAALFLVCAAIERLRIRLFQLLGIHRLCDCLDRKVTGLYEKTVHRCTQIQK